MPLIGASVSEPLLMSMCVRTYVCPAVRPTAVRPRWTARLRMREIRTPHSSKCICHLRRLHEGWVTNKNAKREAAPRQRFRIPIPAIAKRGYGMAKTALPIQPPFVCDALLGREKKQSATWLLYRVLHGLLVAVVSASSLTLAPQCPAFH